MWAASIGGDMGQFQRLSPAGASALSIWALRASEAEFRQLFGVQWVPQTNGFAVVSPGRGEGEAAIWDQALCWRRESNQDLVEAELHLHGGYGVADALREWLRGHAWQEKPWCQKTESQILLQQATTPLAMRLALQEERTQADLDQLLERADDPTAEHLRPQLIASWKASQWAHFASAPPLVVMLGPANAGKSTLFNRWLRDRRATTTSMAGTTRDPLESLLLLGRGEAQLAIRLADTAGYSSAASPLDQQSWEMSQELASKAWKVLWVLDAAEEPDAVLAAMVQKRRPQDLLILNRTDLAPHPAWVDGFGEVDGHLHHQDPASLEQLEQAILESLGPIPSLDTPLSRAPERRQLLAKRLKQHALAE